MSLQSALEVLPPLVRVERRRRHDSLFSFLMAGDLDRLAPHSLPVEFVPGEHLSGEGGWCFVLESGLVSIVVGQGADAAVEVGLIGPGNLIGVWSAVGLPQPGEAARAVTPGRALRFPARLLANLAEANPPLRQFLLAEAQGAARRAMQLVICTAVHRIEQRLARWILVADRHLGGGPIPITHDQVAGLLGVRRASITVAMHVLEGERAVRSRRGLVLVRDRSHLETLSCGCFRALAGPNPA